MRIKENFVMVQYERQVLHKYDLCRTTVLILMWHMNQKLLKVILKGGCPGKEPMEGSIIIARLTWLTIELSFPDNAHTYDLFYYNH